MAVEILVDVGYIVPKFDNLIMSPSFKNMGVAATRLHTLSDIAPRTPFVIIFINHP